MSTPTVLCWGGRQACFYRIPEDITDRAEELLALGQEVAFVPASIDCSDTIVSLVVV